MRRALAVVMTTALLVVAVPGGANAQTTAGCDADAGVTFPDPGLRIYSNRSPNLVDVSVPAIPAGTYAIVGATFDSYPNRVNISQPFEQLRMQFLDASGTVIDQTGPTPDLADLVETAEWGGPLGEVTLDRPAVTVRAIHDFIGTGATPNSLSPTCAGWTLQAPPTTTSTTTTTTTVEPPESTTTVAPETTTTTVPPTTTSSGTITSVPVVELPPVQETPDPEPVTGTPSFTG